MRKWLLILAIAALAGIVVGCTQAAATPVNQPALANTSTPVYTNTPTATSGPATQDQASTPATGSNGIKTVRISDILTNPKQYDGQTVIVEGKIVSECGSGCWFTLRDNTAVIYIDLAPNNMVIPQKKGSFARVTAEVVKEGSDVYLIGSKVDF